MHRSYRGIDIVLRVDELPVEAVAGVGGQLGKEGALGASVAVTKRMQGVDVADVVSEPIDDSMCSGRQKRSVLARTTVLRSPAHS